MGAKVEQGDAIAWLNAQPEGSVDLVFGSPPYCDARTYGIGAQRQCVEWVEWMLQVTKAAHRVSRGPVFWVAAGVTRKRNYWPACEGLMWEWWKQGGEHQLYRPCCWHRVGIPGSGNSDYLRADWEYVMCFKRPGELAWSDNTAMGHPPKWPLGGKMTYRNAEGERRHKIRATSGNDGSGRPVYHKQVDRKVTEISNPGNVIKTLVGGGHLGDDRAHENEAPFPEKLVEFFVRSFCPPDGTVCDVFSGSGTTAAVALQYQRNFIGCDLRQSQVDLTKRRISEVQTSLFV